MSQESTVITSATKPSSPILSLVEGRPATTSREVAKFFDKRHTDVLRDLGQITANCPKEFSQRNFASAEYSDEQGKSRPMFYLFRDGFTLLAMGYTGQKAMQFKLAYIEAFNRMEAELREQVQQALPPAEQPALESSNARTQLSVPFHDTSLCIVEHKGEPYVPLVLICEGMGISRTGQCGKLDKSRARWELEYINITIKFSRLFLCIPLRLLQKYLNSVKSDMVKPCAKSGVELYQRECFQTLLDAWRSYRTEQEFLPSGGESMPALLELFETWGEVSQYSPSAMKMQLQAAFAVKHLIDLSAEQLPQVMAWVQNNIDEVKARERKRLSRVAIDAVPSVPSKAESTFTSPALNEDDPLAQADALMREYDDTQIRQSKELHVRIMKLIHWPFVGMEWFDLASNVICCMLSAPRNERSGRAGEPALPVQFAQQLNKLLSRARWQEIDASRRPAA